MRSTNALARWLRSGGPYDLWQDDGWYVGELTGLPVFSQGRTIEDLERNLEDACLMMIPAGALDPASDDLFEPAGAVR